MSVLERLKAAWIAKSPSSTPLPELPHLAALDDDASPERVRRDVERTIVECEEAAEENERQLERRRFVVAFLRDFLERTSSPVAGSRDPTPIAPARRRRRARQTQPPTAGHDQVVAPVSKNHHVTRMTLIRHSSAKAADVVTLWKTLV